MEIIEKSTAVFVGNIGYSPSRPYVKSERSGKRWQIAMHRRIGDAQVTNYGVTNRTVNGVTVNVQTAIVKSNVGRKNKVTWIAERIFGSLCRFYPSTRTIFEEEPIHYAIISAKQLKVLPKIDTVEVIHYNDGFHRASPTYILSSTDPDKLEEALVWCILAAT